MSPSRATPGYLGRMTQASVDPMCSAFPAVAKQLWPSSLPE